LFGGESIIVNILNEQHLSLGKGGAQEFEGKKRLESKWLRLWRLTKRREKIE
jgi:hypothetical protein